eukprot:scaffold8142_cov1223-Prasinococcus_capsulatus_cf.AAC.1
MARPDCSTSSSHATGTNSFSGREACNQSVHTGTGCGPTDRRAPISAEVRSHGPLQRGRAGPRPGPGGRGESHATVRGNAPGPPGRG